MQIKNHTLILSIALTLMFALGFYVFAWTAPTFTPETGNAPAPINVGSTKQTKTSGIEMTYSILTPGSAPTGANGTMYYDSTAKKFKCYQDGNFVDCISSGGFFKTDDSATPDANILIVINPGRTDKAARITNLLTPVNPSDAATKAYVDAQLAIGGSGGTRWFIKPTPGTHDGNFGGWPGIDRFCQQQINPTCVVFSSDIFNSAYVAEENLDFGSWDTAIATQGWWGYRGGYPYNLSGSGVLVPSPVSSWIYVPGSYQSLTCYGWTSISATTPNSGANNGSMFKENGSVISSPCATPQNVICACLTP